MRQRIIKAISILLMVAGIIVFLYPDIAALKQQHDTENYIDEFEHMYPDSLQNETGDDNLQDMPYQDLYNAILEYNVKIYKDGQKDFKDAWCYTQTPINIDCLDNDLFGYIEIPSMDVKLPLYIGASESNMAKGATVMGQTSIPISGTNTNSVIAGHRGYGGSPYFKYIENVKLGDYIYITNPWGTLIYQAVEISIIDPYDSDAVKIREGKDMVTLLTCHPYASGGRYRYLIFCERVEDDSQNAPSLPVNWEEANKSLGDSQHSDDAILAEDILRRVGACIIFLIIVYSVFHKKRNSVRS